MFAISGKHSVLLLVDEQYLKPETPAWRFTSVKTKLNLNGSIHFWRASSLWSILIFCNSEPEQISALGAMSSTAIHGASRVGDPSVIGKTIDLMTSRALSLERI